MTTLNNIYKSLYYRMWSLIITAIIFYLITKDIETTTAITVIVELTKTVNYFLFECIWKKIKEVKNNGEI